jgi:hypothetical protein
VISPGFGRAFFCPPWMAGMQQMQEHFAAPAMDGRHAGNAGAFSGAPRITDNARS